MKNYKLYISFFILNFGALMLGGLFTGPGVSSEWYKTLNQAPWTPPGSVFGIAWTLIMICFTFYMVGLYSSKSNRSKFLKLYTIQWLLNVSWSIAFFHFQSPIVALVIICALLIVIILFLLYYIDHHQLSFLLLLPYIIWLIMATSLNLFISINNVLT